ncbi:MAG: proline dehydrogenase family protein [Bacteroidota bacterium]|nr:proline dehydrogenase family protein [Bacteroidota bacterium]
MNNVFNNTEVAFGLKSNKELKRAKFLFEMIASPTLVKIGTKLTMLSLNLHLPVKGIIRSTVFDHFCGGETEQECLTVVDKMYSKGVSSVLDYSVEGKETEAHFDDALKVTLRTIDYAKNHKGIPIVVFKPTGFGRFELFEKLGENKSLTEAEQKEWNRVVERFDIACKTAHQNDIIILVDAEHSWMQDAADELVEQMMMKYNKDKAIVFNTLQMYRWDRLDYLKSLHQKAKQHHFHIGMKVVRGAYMEIERQRAKEKGYKDPICETKELTDINYNNAIAYMMEHIESMAIFAGTHNEQSSYKLIDLLKQKNIDKKDRRIWFGQLYGMSDNISFNLANQGYNVAKYLPFGPVKDVMPYLIRRAEENTSVAGQTGRELSLINIEMKRRNL